LRPKLRFTLWPLRLCRGEIVERNGMLAICKGGCYATTGSGGGGGSAGASQDAAADVDCVALGCTSPAVCNSCPAECSPPPCTEPAGQLVDLGGTLYTCVDGCYAQVSGDGG
jgi:hypothetical protein